MTTRSSPVPGNNPTLAVSPHNNKSTQRTSPEWIGQRGGARLCKEMGWGEEQALEQQGCPGPAAGAGQGPGSNPKAARAQAPKLQPTATACSGHSLRGTFPGTTTLHRSPTAPPGSLFNYSPIKSPVITFSLTSLCY